jgi:hypothetical protein
VSRINYVKSRKTKNMTLLRNRLYIIILCLLHIVLGINGSIGGILLAIKPDGSLLGMQAGWLNNSPFKNYFIPGILLAIFLGVMPIITSIGLTIKKNWKWPNLFNIYRNRFWAWSFSLYTGIIAIFWITFQLLLTKYFWIQPVIIFFGLFIIILTMIPYVMRNYETDPA